jgi:hypothetical protein
MDLLYMSSAENRQALAWRMNAHLLFGNGNKSLLLSTPCDANSNRHHVSV